MTLHEAIEKLLKETGRPMTTTEIADALTRNKWYTKKDGSAIKAFQIHGRTRNYSQMFDRDGSTVKLKGYVGGIQKKKDHNVSMKVHTLDTIQEADKKVQEKVLMNEGNCKDAGSIDNLVPDVPGIYCIRIKDIKALPAPFADELKNRCHNILYIGIASQSLQKRFLGQELRARGHGTFFRSIGAVLGYRPPLGSLIDKKNKKNYTFSIPDENAIIKWINKNLIVYWIKNDKDLGKFETYLIREYEPLLNIAKNPVAMKALSKLRKECVDIANQKK